jgi:hypothetical protein
MAWKSAGVAALSLFGLLTAPEFPLPGEGKILSLADLSIDPEGKQIAKGFLQYLKILSLLKEVRDHSQLNHDTPLISAGMVSAPDGEKLYNNKREDMVSLPATMAFLRANGLDGLVDAYGIHSYPTGDHPGDPAAAAGRTARFESVDLSPCRAPAQPGGKPCWITEWGFANGDLSCPLKDSGRALLVKEMRVNFAGAAKEGRLAGIVYFAWNSDPWSKQLDADSIFRCDGLTESGELAVAPLTKAEFDAAGGIRVRVGVPFVARGPGAIADSWFTETKLPDGRYRGFTALGSTLAIDGKEPYSMGGTAATVLKPGPPGSPSSCGEWIQHAELQGKTLLGWVHNETACNYAKGQTHASMTFATSSDCGLTWKIEGPIITGRDPPAAGKGTGDSCPTVIRGKDEFYYAYCLRNGGQSWNGGYTFLARAPIAQPGPGNWKKLYNGAWSEPGVGGTSSPVDGLAVGYWLTADKTVSLKWVKGGLGVALSQDRIHFTDALSEPLMLTEPGDWSRHNGAELTAYHDLIDAKTGLNLLGDHWLMTYMYLKPKEGFDKRYLVFRPIDVWPARKGDEPASGVMLAHWYDAAHHDHVSTIAPLPGNWSVYTLVEQSGYLMTAPDARRKTVALEECVSKWPGHPDHILIEKGVCETQDYERLRAAGYVFSTEEPDTRPLYRCYSDAEKSHFASNKDDCGQMGRREALLGYVLKD